MFELSNIIAFTYLSATCTPTMPIGKDSPGDCYMVHKDINYVMFQIRTYATFWFAYQPVQRTIA